MNAKANEKMDMIAIITFNQIKKKTLNLQDPKYDLCKVLSMC